jgi:hypothetical protein
MGLVGRVICLGFLAHSLPVMPVVLLATIRQGRAEAFKEV